MKLRVIRGGVATTSKLKKKPHLPDMYCDVHKKKTPHTTINGKEYHCIECKDKRKTW